MSDHVLVSSLSNQSSDFVGNTLHHSMVDVFQNNVEAIAAALVKLLS